MRLGADGQERAPPLPDELRAMVVSNEAFRRVLFTAYEPAGAALQQVAMTLIAGEDTVLEQHSGTTQVFHVYAGSVAFVVAASREAAGADWQARRMRILHAGDVLQVLPGQWHVLQHHGVGLACMLSTYYPPHHPYDRVDKRRSDAVWREAGERELPLHRIDYTIDAVTPAVLDRLLALRVAPEQERWVGTPDDALAYAYMHPEAVPLVLYYAPAATGAGAGGAGGASPPARRLVGFAMYSKADPKHNCITIERFLIGSSHQAKGHGRALFLMLLELLWSNEAGGRSTAVLPTSTAGTRPYPAVIKLSLHEENTTARRFYGSFGFVPYGMTPDHILMYLPRDGDYTAGERLRAAAGAQPYNFQEFERMSEVANKRKPDMTPVDLLGLLVGASASATPQGRPLAEDEAY
jgi:GNAT superfamily N-acetyltransferase